MLATRPILLSLAFLGSPQREPDSAAQAEARTLVEKAIAAQGGLDKLTAARATLSRIKGKFQGETGHFHGEVKSQSGGKIHVSLNFKEDNRPSMRLLVLDGEKGWMQVDGVTLDLDQEMLTRLKKASHVDRVAGLTVLLRKKTEYQLALLGESKVKDTPALGIKVVHAGMPDVHLYFDKASGLLLKTAHRDKDIANGREIFKEMYFNDYRLVDVSAADVETLNKAKLGTGNAELLAFLGRCTPDDGLRQRIGELVRQLGDSSFGRRQKASAELTRIGIAAAGQLRAARKSTDAEVARRAEQCLTKLRQSAALENVSAAVRLIGLRKPEGAAAALLAYFPHAADEAVGREVQDALVAGALASKTPDPILGRALTDSNPLRREAATAALGRDGGAYQKKANRRIFLDGLRLSYQVSLYRDGKLDMESSTTHFEFFNRFDDSLFLRP